MKEKKEVIRKNIRMSKTIGDWVEEKAAELGISQANLMVTAIAEYKKQDEVLNAMKNYEGIMQKIKEIDLKERKTP